MNPTPDNRQIYDANWRSWIDMKVHGPASRWLRALVYSQIQGIPSPNGIHSVLDFGCGEGTITHAMAEWLPHAQVTGIDFSMTGIQCAHSRYGGSNLRFIHDEAAQRLSQQYDLVTAFEVLEHVEDWQELLSRIAGAAQQFVLLSFPTGRMRDFEKDMGHYRNFKRGEVEEFMWERGFGPRAVCYAGFPFYSPLYRDFCNLTLAAGSSFVSGPYGPAKKTLSDVLYLLFRFLSTKRRFGDQFCGLFARRLAAP